MKPTTLMIIGYLVRLQQAYAPIPSALLNGMLDIHSVVVSTINLVTSILFGICCSLSTRTREDLNGSLSRYLDFSIILLKFWGFELPNCFNQLQMGFDISFLMTPFKNHSVFIFTLIVCHASRRRLKFVVDEINCVPTQVHYTYCPL